jgi:predicted alpha/beta-fold hydrolase
VPHFRGCSGELNLAPRAYHSGDFEEIGWILGRLRERQGAALRPWASRWAAMRCCAGPRSGRQAAHVVRALAAVSSPVDLAAAGQAIDRGFNRLVYARMFLRTMKPKALAKWQQHPGLFDRAHAAAARTLYEFDDVFTAPLHGFAGTDDYWARASAKPHLAASACPRWCSTRATTPSCPAASLPTAAQAGRFVTLWQPAHGGHVGFPAGRFPGHVRAMPEAVVDWLAARPWR